LVGDHLEPDTGCMMHVRERTMIAGPAGVDEDRWLAPLMRAEIDPIATACCCPAPAVYAVVLAPTERMPNPPEVLLCAHHMWVSRARLTRPDVAVYDAAGHLVELNEQPRRLR
jgi:hypothetical protein